MLRNFVHGAPASEVQQFAASVLEEFGPAVTSSSVQALANFGNSGSSPGNCLRDLFRLNFLNGAKVQPPPLYYAQVEFKSLSSGALFEHKQHPFLLPHEYLACLSQGEEVFERMMLGPGHSVTRMGATFGRFGASQPRSHLVLGTVELTRFKLPEVPKGWRRRAASGRPIYGSRRIDVIRIRLLDVI